MCYFKLCLNSFNFWGVSFRDICEKSLKLQWWTDSNINLLCKSVDRVIHKKTLVLTTYAVFHYVNGTSLPQDGLESFNKLFTFFHQSRLKPTSNFIVSCFLEIQGKYKA